MQAASSYRHTSWHSTGWLEPRPPQISHRDPARWYTGLRRRSHWGSEAWLRTFEYQLVFGTSSIERRASAYRVASTVRSRPSSASRVRSAPCTAGAVLSFGEGVIIVVRLTGESAPLTSRLLEPSALQATEHYQNDAFPNGMRTTECRIHQALSNLTGVFQGLPTPRRGYRILCASSSSQPRPRTP